MAQIWVPNSNRGPFLNFPPPNRDYSNLGQLTLVAASIPKRETCVIRLKAYCATLDAEQTGCSCFGFLDVFEI